jgi:uncharacterized protein (DUF849 family)
MSPHLPVTPDQIASESIAAAEAGASILHLHARDPETGRPTPSTEVFCEFLPRIKQSTTAVINISTGGAPGMTMDQRLAASEWASPEMASLNMGSLNFGLFPVLDKMKDFKYPWEAQFLEASRDLVFKNTFKDIELIFQRLGNDHGCRFEFECYDLGHLYNLAHFIDKGMYEPPLFIQFCLGILGGAAAEIDNLLFLVRTAERLFGDKFEWSILGAGRHQMSMATQNVLLGGNARVGLEDSLMIERGRLATSNAQQVAKLVTIVKSLGLTVATPDEARKRLKLKGFDQVGF